MKKLLPALAMLFGVSNAGVCATARSLDMDKPARIGAQGDLAQPRYFPWEFHQPESGHRMRGDSLSGDGNEFFRADHLHGELRQVRSGREMAGRRFRVRHVDAVGDATQRGGDVGFRFLRARVTTQLLFRLNSEWMFWPSRTTALARMVWSLSPFRYFSAAFTISMVRPVLADG